MTALVEGPRRNASGSIRPRDSRLRGSRGQDGTKTQAQSLETRAGDLFVSTRRSLALCAPAATPCGTSPEAPIRAACAIAALPPRACAQAPLLVPRATQPPRPSHGEGDNSICVCLLSGQCLLASSWCSANKTHTLSSACLCYRAHASVTFAPPGSDTRSRPTQTSATHHLPQVLPCPSASVTSPTEAGVSSPCLSSMVPSSRCVFATSLPPATSPS